MHPRESKFTYGFQLALLATLPRKTPFPPGGGGGTSGMPWDSDEVAKLSGIKRHNRKIHNKD
jgi:hypothetical protein